MAEELETKVAELEERLSKATEAYKALKAENANLKKAAETNGGGSDVEGLKNRIKELEDELTINGNSADEIKALNERIEKAKVIFKEQKEKIAQSTELLTKLNSENSELSEQVTSLNTRIAAYEKAISGVQEIVRGL